MNDLDFAYWAAKIILHTLFGVTGALLIYGLRNDTVERIGSVEITRSIYMTAAFGLSIAILSGRAFHAMEDLWALVMTLLAGGWVLAIWSMPHGPTLRGPKATLRWDPDPILWFVLLMTRGKEFADRATRKGGVRGAIMAPEIGFPTWATYNLIRYCVPCIAIQIFIPNTWVGLAGPLIVFGYWPMGHFWHEHLDSEPQYVGAVVGGFCFYALL